MTGLLTRLAALCSMGFSVLLMAMFGWQGATCIDEWTMAACNLAMGASLLLAGSGAYSLDNFLLHRNPALAGKQWFRWMSGSLPIAADRWRLQEAGVGCARIRRDLQRWHLQLLSRFGIDTFSRRTGQPDQAPPDIEPGGTCPDGSVRFHVYLDAGTPEAPAHVVAAELLNNEKHPVANWNAAQLSKLPKTDFANDYAYNRFEPGPFRGSDQNGSRRHCDIARACFRSCRCQIQLTDVDGRTFSATFSGSNP